jgi:putative component of toxin-antitoxin plasmid stabilization module
MYELKVFAKGDSAPFTEWLRDLKDIRARARIRTRLDRLTLGNFGDHRALEGGILNSRLIGGRAIACTARKPGRPSSCCFAAAIKNANARHQTSQSVFEGV